MNDRFNKSNPYHALSRRDFLRSGAGAWIAAGLWPGALAAQAAERSAASPNEIFFVVMNDTHFLDERCAPFFEAAVSQIGKSVEKLDFCLIAGDLATDGKESELKPLKEILYTLPCPVYTVPGNHDFNGESCKAYETLFPQSRNFIREENGWTLIGLDTCDGPRWKEITIPGATFEWMRKELPQLDKANPTIVFTHFPLAEGVQMRPKNAAQVLELLWDHNLKAIFCGHFHGYTLKERNGVPLTTNRCLSRSRGNHDGTKEKGYFLCQSQDGRIERKFVEFKFEPS